MADAATGASAGSSKLDLPLSDIIATDNASRPKRGGRRGGSRGGNRQSGGRGGGGNRRSSGGNFSNPLSRAHDDDDQDDSQSGPMRRGRQQSRSGPYSRGGDSNGAWSHDLYETAAPTNNFVPAAAKVQGDAVSVSNLAKDITDEDLLEIFGRIGAISRANVNFNSSAESLGTAEVQFTTGQLAEQAVRELDGAQVDGRAMSVKLIASITRPRTVVQRQPPQSSAPRPQRNLAPRTGGFVNRRNSNQGSSNGSSSSGGRQGGTRGRQQGGARGGGGRGGRGGRGRSTGPKKDVSAADLDDEMEKYQAARGAPTGSAAAE